MTLKRSIDKQVKRTYYISKESIDCTILPLAAPLFTLGLEPKQTKKLRSTLERAEIIQQQVQ